MDLSKIYGSHQGAALMKRTTKYVGLDVHQATTVVSVRETNGRVMYRGVLPTDASALLDFFRGMRGSIHVALEEGTHAQWLHDLLEEIVGRVIVCDRRGLKQSGNKGDQVDADQLSDQLRKGGLKAVYHGGGVKRTALKEVTRAYCTAVDDATRVKLRLKAIYRARAIRTKGDSLFKLKGRSEWLAKLPIRASRIRAELLFQELDVLEKVKTKAKLAMVAEARRDSAYKTLRTIPFIGPVRASVLLATLQTPWRFRTKRNLWAYAGLAVVTRSSGDHVIEGGRVVRRRRAPLTRGLNRNHNRVVKNVFKSAAVAALGRPGPLREFYDGLIARGVRDELARVTLARKIAALTLRLWKTEEEFDGTKLTLQAT